MCKIDVVIPVYNVEKYLIRCVESVLCQTFCDIRIVLVDDGSTDSSGELCDKYATEDDRVFVIHQPNEGVSSARNTGIEWALSNSNSKWITFIDSDDWVNPTMLEKLWDTVLHKNIAIAVCGAQVAKDIVENVNYESKAQFVEYSFEQFYEKKFEFVNIITPWGKLYKKDLFTDIRYPKGMINEDIYTTYKLLYISKKIAVLDYPFYYYFIGNTDSIMRSKWSPKRLDEIRGYEEMIDFMSSKGYDHAMKRMIETYYWSLDRQIKILQQEENAAYGKYEKLLKKKLRIAIKKYNYLVPVSLKERHWLLEDIYPSIMKIYWKFKLIFNKESGE